MTYEEAQEKLFKVRWKTEPCFAGEDCWCRMIVPEEPILFQGPSGFEDEIYVVGSAAIDKEIAEYFVQLHNKNLEK